MLHPFLLHLLKEPFKISLHISHSLHGSPSFGFKQFIALDKTFAADVFPVPLPPLKDMHVLLFLLLFDSLVFL